VLWRTATTTLRAFWAKSTDCEIKLLKT